jgi:hypothetical protein
MKIRYILVSILGFLTYFAIHYSILSYGNVKAHPSINGAIVEKFNELMNSPGSRPKKFENYEFKFDQDKNLFKGKAVTNPGFFAATTGQSEESKTLTEWIKHGGYSADEPEVPASVRHFYDPIGLNGGKKYLTNNGTWWEGYYGNPSTDAIEWALGDSPKGKENVWSLDAGKTNMFLALSTKDTNERKAYLAKAFRSIGEVLHNTGDMGCPPHVRNDSHASPIGFSLGQGRFMGSPDPYEEYLVDSCGNTYKGNSPDDDLKSYFEGASTIRSINVKLATFTNSNFFTHETINGFVDDIYLKSPINKDGNYPNPRLENLEYNNQNYTFSKQFPSGRTVVLCKDYSFFSLKGRGYPYVDFASVRSQATELIPDIISAGVNVMRLFIPYLRIELTEVDDLSDTIQIKVIHETDSEYPDKIYYHGKINFKLNGKIHDSTIVMDDGMYGIFKGVLPFTIKNGDKLEAFIDLSSIIINCDKELVIKMDPLWGQWYLKEVLDASNDPAAPKAGTVFTGIKFYTVLKNGMIKITNLDGTGLQQFNYSRNSLSFTISGASTKQSYSQTGSVDGNQETWSAQTKSNYKQGSGSSEVEYYRNYSSQGSRKKIP